MSIRIATFNVENLLRQFDYSGFRNQLNRDRLLSLYDIKDEHEYRLLEQAREMSTTDDMRQQTALAIATTRADIICMMEVDNMEALNAFEYGYLFKMVGEGYRKKYTTAGNDSRGIDVGIMMQEETDDGQPIELVKVQSYAHLTYKDFDLHTPELEATGNQEFERIFRRDCLEVDLRIGGKPLTIYITHLKSMGAPRNGLSGREATMPIRNAEALAIRRIIEERFGKDHTDRHRWLICGDFNDYYEKLVISGGLLDNLNFDHVREQTSALDILLEDGFCENLVERRPVMDRWTFYHNRGLKERHLCQLDYILASPMLAKQNPNAVPDIVRNGQPYRTPFPPGQEVPRFPRIGWDRPKASDHCPVAVTLDILD